MARTAVFGDSHGNVVALEAVLAAIAAADVAEIVCLGDVALFGPDPAGCVDRVRAVPGIRLVQGNTDRYLAEGRPEPALAWCAERLGPERIAWLASLPTRQRIEHADALCVHASPRGDEEQLAASLPAAELDTALAGVAETLVLHGHTHEQYLRELGGQRRIANPGSSGLPFDGDRGAAWALVDGREVALRRTPYDVDSVIAGLAATDNPARELVSRRLRTARA